MPKPRKTGSHRSQVARNLTGPGSSASGAGQSQMSANSMTINCTAMPSETLRFMLSQRHLNQTGPHRALITRLQESDSPASNTAPQVPDQLSAMIASIYSGSQTGQFKRLQIHKWTGRPAWNRTASSLAISANTDRPSKSRPSPRSVGHPHSLSDADKMADKLL